VKLIIPDQITGELAYETGLHIGDGSMNYYSGHGLYSLRGDKIKDRLFFEQIVKPLYNRLYNADVHLREWTDVFGFQIASTELVDFKKKLGLPLGPKNEVKIPALIMADNSLSLSCLRGLFETDGNFYLEPKNRKLYPRLEFSTTSKILSEQVCNILANNILPFSVWKRDYTNGWKTIYRVCIRGFPNLNRWLDLVGLNHPFMLQKLRILDNQQDFKYSQNYFF